MNKKLPILIIIPHGGYKIPEELLEYISVNDFDLFIHSDTCASELFDFGEKITGQADTFISPLFIDTDFSEELLPPFHNNHVIKTKTSFGKSIFKEEVMPDITAMKNLIKRYYQPFHNTIENIISSNDIELILECHTIMASGPELSDDPGEPRPSIRLENTIEVDGNIIKTCDDNLVSTFMDNIKKSFSSEKGISDNMYEVKKEKSTGHIMKKYGQSNIPMVRLSVSRAFFLNDQHFSYDYLKVDELRIKSLNKNLWNSLSKSFKKFF